VYKQSARGARFVGTKKKDARVHVYLFIFSIVSDRYRCIRAVAFFSDVIEAIVFWLYAQRSLSLHSGVGAGTCISDVYRCYHVKVARSAIAIAAIGRLRLSAMAIAACMVILRATCCLEFVGPRTRNMFLLTTRGCLLVVMADGSA
jgi:succinate dehydrogenase hydrophobic anchor subunit